MEEDSKSDANSDPVLRCNNFGRENGHGIRGRSEYRSCTNEESIIPGEEADKETEGDSGRDPIQKVK